jgi:hypothetical protein
MYPNVNTVCVERIDDYLTDLAVKDTEAISWREVPGNAFVGRAVK